MSGIKLHHVQYGRSFRILWLLEEMGLTGAGFEVVEYQIGSKEMARGGLASVSPATRIPALEMDGLQLFESGAILEYLIETRAAHLGVAPGAPERATYLQWIHFSETMASLIEQLNLQMVFLRPPAKASPVVLKLNVARLRHTLRGLDARLEGREFILDRGFSGADIMFGFNVFAAPFYVDMAAFPNIAAWVARIESMPSYQRTVAREGKQRFYEQDFYPVPEA